MFGGGLFSGLLSGLVQRLLGRLFGGGGGGSSCPAVPFIAVGHKFWKRFRRLKVNHACRHCDGTGAVIYSAPGSPVPARKACPHCDGTGEDPENPAPRPPEGLNRRQRKQWLKEHRPEVAPWGQSQWVRMPTEMCARGCGALNPVWRDTAAMRPREETGLLWRVLGWVWECLRRD